MAIAVDASVVGLNYVQNNIAYMAARGISGGIQSANLVEKNPLFTNPAAGAFTLKIGSPAIDTGVTNLIATKDFNGVARPQGRAFDIGAYEFVSGSLPIPPSRIRILPAPVDL